MWKPVSASVIVLLFGSSAYAQSQNIDIASIPQNVMATASQQVTGFTPQSANTEVEDGKTIYDIQGTAGGKQVDTAILWHCGSLNERM